MDELGVGIVYFKGFENFIASHSSLIDVVEIEPQTFWYDINDECDAYKYDREAMNFLASYHKPKLFHGVGYPIGGTCAPSQLHFNTLNEQIDLLNPSWISEHLSFNLFNDAGAEINSGFLLPTLQSEEGVRIAAANIRQYREKTSRPFAFETGTNYLRPRKNEMADGHFTARVAEEADCSILLDLHNILANQRNGRQSVKDFIKQLPTERIIELHVGGGFYYKDFYLDAHSGLADIELMSILDEVVGKLPNLKALMFEIDPDSFGKVPETSLTNQLITMRQIWDKRGFYYRAKKASAAKLKPADEQAISVQEWEYTLGKLVLGKDIESPLADELRQDKGVAIIKDMVFNFRGSVLISMLKHTTRLLRLWIGEAAFRRNVDAFFNFEFPELLPVIVAKQFAAYIQNHNIKVPYLDKVLEYELASIFTAIDKQNRSVSFDFDPLPLFAALDKATLPHEALADKPVTLQVVFDRQPKALVACNLVVHN